jgi:hypothetical protein
MCTILRDDVFFCILFALTGVRFWLFVFDFTLRERNGFGVVHCCTWCCCISGLESTLFPCTIPHSSKKKCILALFGNEMDLEILWKYYNYLPQRVYSVYWTMYLLSMSPHSTYTCTVANET